MSSSYWDDIGPTPPSMAIGHFLRVIAPSGATIHSFQNFYIGQALTVSDMEYSFVPFGFSGLSSSRQGDLSPATVVFPNTPLSRGILTVTLGHEPGAVSAQTLYSVGQVDVCVLNPGSPEIYGTLFTYTGQITGGGWGDTELMMELSSVLDAVNAQIPSRILQQGMVGGLPTSSSVRMR